MTMEEEVSGIHKDSNNDSPPPKMMPEGPKMMPEGRIGHQRMKIDPPPSIVAEQHRINLAGKEEDDPSTENTESMFTDSSSDSGTTDSMELLFDLGYDPKRKENAGRLAMKTTTTTSSSKTGPTPMVIQRTLTEESSCDINLCRMRTGICIDCTKCSFHCTCNKSICIDCTKPEKHCICNNNRLPTLSETSVYEVGVVLSSSAPCCDDDDESSTDRMPSPPPRPSKTLKPRKRTIEDDFSIGGDSLSSNWTEEGEVEEAGLDHEKVAELDKLIESGNWDGLVQAAAQFEAEAKSEAPSTTSSTRSSLTKSSSSSNDSRLRHHPWDPEETLVTRRSSKFSSSKSSSPESRRNTLASAAESSRSTTEQNRPADPPQQQELSSSCAYTPTRKGQKPSSSTQTTKPVVEDDESTDQSSDINSDESTVVLSNEAFFEDSSNHGQTGSLMMWSCADGIEEEDDTVSTSKSENRLVRYYGDRAMPPPTGGADRQIIMSQPSLGDESNILVVSQTGDHSELTDPEDQSIRIRNRSIYNTTKKRNSSPPKKLSFFSQVCSGFVTIAFLVLVLGGMTTYVLMDQGIWNPFVVENTPTTAPTKAPTLSLIPQAPASAPVAPIFPGIGRPSSDDGGGDAPPVALWEPPTRQPTTGAPTRTPTTKAPTKYPTSKPISPPPAPLPTVSPPPAPTPLPPTPYPTPYPTPKPTPNPTSSPTRDVSHFLTTFLSQYGFRFSSAPLSPENLALSWMSLYDGIVLDDTPSGGLDPNVIIQRFAVATLKFAISPNFYINNGDSPRGMFGQDKYRTENPSWIIPVQHECTWTGVVCDAVTRTVKEIQFGSRDLHGRIPVEIQHLKNLTTVDISNNVIGGSIPESFYTLTNLEKIYMYENQISGTLSSSIGNLNRLTAFIASENQISGSIPTTNGIKPYKYFNVYSNRMTGTIPEFLRWRQLYLLDLGRNQFSGTLPEDLGENFVRLRHLHLDHNRFHGTLPESFINAGNGRLEALTVDNNQLTGEVPGNHLFENLLVSFTFHNNDFSEMDSGVCDQSIFEDGAMVEMKADCDICRCDGIFCDNCNQ